MSEQPKTVPDAPPADAPPADATANIASSAAYETRNVVSDTDPESTPSFGPPQKSDEIGTLGPYRVLRELGRGGMGAVYLGFDERLKRKVALKVMLPKYAAIASSKNRFLREARAAARIAHDHIVTIYEADEHSGTPYMAMQLLQGYPLDTYLKLNGQIDLAELLRIGREMALGLSAAHEVGLVHRDVKPGNIWLEAPNGRVKILDFGLAKPTDEQKVDLELTATGVIMGTPAYMPPEQARGAKADFRADLFSLGVVLYRLATGAMPFTGDTMLAVLAAVVADDPTPVRERNPDIPEPLAKLIHELLEKKPQNRPKSAAEVAERMQQIRLGTAAAISLPMQVIPLDSFPTATHVPPGTDPFANIDATEPDEVVSRTVAAVPAAKKSNSTPKWPLIALGLLLVVLAALVPRIASILTPKGTLVIESNDPDVEITVKRGGAVIVDKSKLREFALSVADDYTIEMTEKEGLKLSANKFEILRNGKAVVKVTVQRPSPPGKSRVEPPFPGATPVVPPAWQGPSPLDSLDPAKIPAEEKFDWQPKELVGVLGTHAARHWGSGTAMAISPDGKVIATGGVDKFVRLWDADTLKPLGTLVGHDDWVRRIAFSPDGKQLLCLSAFDHHLWNLESKTQVRKFSPTIDAKPIGAIPMFDAGGRPIAATYEAKTFNGSVHVVDLAANKPLLELKGHGTEGYIWTARSPDGSRFATLHKGLVQVWNAKTGERLFSWNEMRSGGDNWLAFSPDGKRIAASSGGPNESIDLHVWDIVGGKSVLVLKGACSYYGMSVAFSRDGTRLVIGGHGGSPFHVVEIPSGNTVCKTKNDCTSYSEVGFNADGSRVVSFGTHYGVGGDGILRSFDAKTGEPVGPVTDRVGSIVSVAFSPDLKSVITHDTQDRLRVWNPTTGQSVKPIELTPLGVYSTRKALPFPDGRRAVVLERSATIRDLTTGEVLQELNTVLALTADLSPDGKLLALGMRDESIQLWNVAATPAVRLGSVSTEGHANGTVRFSPDGRRLATEGLNAAAIWDVTAGVPKKLFDLAVTGTPYAIAWAPDGKSVALVQGANLSFWSLDAKSARKLPHEVQTDGEYFVNQVLGYHPTGKWVAVVGQKSGKVFLYNPADGTLANSWTFPAPPADLAFAADGRHLLTANPNGTVYMLRLEIAAANPASAERALAEWVISRRGQVHVVSGGKTTVATAANELPAQPFATDRIDLPNGASIADAEVVRYVTNEKIHTVVVSGTPLGNASAAHFATIKTLVDLHMATTKIDDEGLARLAELPNLRLLTVANTAVTDKGAVLLGGKASLQNLNLHGTNVGDASAIALAKCPALGTLHLSGTKVTDKGLAALEACSSLRVLTLAKAPVTEAGAKKLAEALPLCKVEWDGGTIGPRDANRLAATYVLSVGGKVTLLDRAEELIAPSKLPDGPILISAINLTNTKRIDPSLWSNLTGCSKLIQIQLGATSVTDADLAVLVRCPKLQDIRLYNTSVSNAGLAHLAVRKVWSKIDLNQTAVSDEGLAHLADFKVLTALHLHDCPKVGDAGLKHLKNCTGLRQLDLRKTGASAKGIDELSRSLPRCKIDHDGGTIGPTVTSDAGLLFNGRTTAVRIPTLSFDGKVPITIEAWLTAESTTGQERHVFLFGEPGGGLGIGSKGNIGVGFHNGTDWVEEFGDVVPAGRKVHVAAVVTENAYHLFIDGKSVGYLKGKYDKLPSTRAPALIGVQPKDAPEGHFHGVIHQLRISKSARYLVGYSPAATLAKDADTAALYRFDEGTGTKLTDHSGHDHHGVIENGAWAK